MNTSYGYDQVLMHETAERTVGIHEKKGYLILRWFERDASFEKRWTYVVRSPAGDLTFGTGRTRDIARAFAFEGTALRVHRDEPKS